MHKRFSLIALLLACGAAGSALGAEGKITWFDPSCRYFIMQLPEGSEGFGLYEWKDGPEPAEGMTLAGDILGGPELKVTDPASGNEISVLHWADAKKPDPLLRASPGWCKSKRKKK